MIAFDTLSAATRLRQEAGFSENQARVLVDTFVQCVDESLATQRHVKETEVALRRDMQRMETSLRGDLEKTEASLRGDLEKTEASLRGELASLRDDLEKTEASLRADMRSLEHRMTIKLGGIVSLALGIVVALEKLVF